MCSNEVQWQSKNQKKKERVMKDLLKEPEFIWTMHDGKHLRNGVEMILTVKGRAEKCTIGYQPLPKNQKNRIFMKAIDAKIYVQPPQKSFLKDV
jgi:hypothetical protein